MHLPVIASVQHSAPQHHLRLHPTLPLLAAVDAHHVAAHVWTWREGELMRLGAIGDTTVKRPNWLDAMTRDRRPIDLAWHPTLPLLAVTGFDGVQLWECSLEQGLRLVRTTGVVPSKERVVEDVLYLQGQPGAMKPVTQSRVIPSTPPPYRHAGFSASGRSLWASPSQKEETNEWVSDWFDLENPARKSHSWRWDTDLALHPEGGLLAAFESDQGATLLRFAHVIEEPDGERIETQHRAVVLDVDGYRDLAFNARGDRFLYQGNAYENFCVVHAFPSLERQLVLPLGDWEETSKKLPPSWHEYRWSFFENVIFSPDGDGLLLGLHDGRLVDVSLDGRRPHAHQSLLDRPICSLRARGDLLALTDFEGLLRLYRLPHTPGHADTASRPLTRHFLTNTAPATRLAPWDDLSLTDGEREWSDDRRTADELPANAPTWARLAATLRDLGITSASGGKASDGDAS